MSILHGSVINKSQALIYKNCARFSQFYIDFFVGAAVNCRA